MPRESIVFPIKITGYGEITGMNDWQVFVKWLRGRNEAYDNLLKYVNQLEALLGAPDNPEDEWDAFEAIQNLKREDINKQLLKVLKELNIMAQYYKPKPTGHTDRSSDEDANLAYLYSKVETAIATAEGKGFEHSDMVDAAIAANEWRGKA